MASNPNPPVPPPPCPPCPPAMPPPAPTPVTNRQDKPPAPPLPSPSPAKTKPKTAQTMTYISAEQREFLDVMKRLWEREGWKEPPLLLAYRYIPPILQEGPQCGLVALAMAAASTDYPASVSSLLKEAQIQGFSHHGEMFSVDNMASLARSVLPHISVSVIQGLALNREYIIHHLARGSLLLAPYDADRNHEPSCLNGHKAHWAAVSGALVFSRGCFVTARQGKSKRLMLWDYSRLAASNENLNEICPNRLADGNDYLLPPGGVRAGLCGRAVLLEYL